MSFTWKEALRLPHGNKDCWRLYSSSVCPPTFFINTPTNWYVEKEPVATPFWHWAIDTSESQAFPDYHGPFPCLKAAQQFAETTYLLGE